MILMMAMAILCAAVLAYTLHPVMTGASRKAGWGAMAALMVAALFLYLMLGAPDLPSAAAMFEEGSPRHAARLASQKELVLRAVGQGGGASPE